MVSSLHRKIINNKKTIVMKRLIEYLKQLFSIHNVSNSAEITIWCNDLNEAERLWKEVYMPDGWGVKEPIDTKWNWKRFDYEYRFKLIKK